MAEKNNAEAFGWVVLGILGVAGLIFIGPLIGILAGALVGWVASIVAPVWVPTGLAYIGIKVDANHLVELGAALGFLSGFFRVNAYKHK